MSKIVTCSVTEYVVTSCSREIKEDDVLEWIEKPAPGAAKKGFDLHFGKDSPVGAIIYSKDHTMAKARVGLGLTQGDTPLPFSYLIGPVGEETFADEATPSGGVTTDSLVGHCPGCP